MTTVILARHGETDWNRDHRWQGHADPPLNEMGRAQSRELVARLADVQLEAVYSSDLLRALETARAVTTAKGLQVVADPLLREIDVGEWTGLTTDEIKGRFRAGWERNRMGEDGWERGETHPDMSLRIVSAVSRIAGDHPGGQILCVLHGGVIRALLAHAASMPLEAYRRTRRGPENGSVSTIGVEDGTFRRID